MKKTGIENNIILIKSLQDKHKKDKYKKKLIYLNQCLSY
mgnify:CR=1 FL=1